MPRIARGESAGGIYHVINRGNMRMELFEDEGDYEYFIKLLEESAKRENVDIHAYCIMPNHFHLLLVPNLPSSLSKMMQWLLTSHVRYYHKKHGSCGHLWQGRFKSFIIQKESYYLNVIRYIEANALRASLVQKVEFWRYGSLYERLFAHQSLLAEPFIELSANWPTHVNEIQKESTLKVLRNSVNRQTPLGEMAWQEQTVAKYGLETSFNPKGRPRKE